LALVKRMLELNPKKRIDAEHALNDSYFWMEGIDRTIFLDPSMYVYCL
jgi:hypothetical protein